MAKGKRAAAKKRVAKKRVAKTIHLYDILIEDGAIPIVAGSKGNIDNYNQFDELLDYVVEDLKVSPLEIIERMIWHLRNK